MPSLEDLRQKFPMYNDLPDEKFIEGFHKKFYSDMPLEELHKKIGYDPEPQTTTESTQLQADLGSLGRAAQALPGSVAHGVSDIWHTISHYDEVYANLKEKGFSGIAKDIGADLKTHYGSIERAKKTFETDPFKFVTDISIPISGASGLAKLGMTAAKIGRSVLPEVAATTKAPASALRTAGEAGRLGGPEAAEYRAGVAGWPSPIATATQGAQAGPALAARQAMAPFGQAGQDVRAAGWVPPLNVKTAAKVLAGKEIGIPLWAAPLLSPRVGAAASYGLGALERGLSKVPTSRAAIIAAAGGLLRDRNAKQDLDSDQRKTLRKVSRGEADSSTMMRANSIMQALIPSAAAAEAPQYGGTDAGRSTASTSGLEQQGLPLPPSPGQPSQPGPSAGLGPGAGGPGAAPAGPGPGQGQPQGLNPSPVPQPPQQPQQGLNPSPMMGGTLPLPGQSPGLSRVQTTGQEPVAPVNRAGKTFMQHFWDQLIEEKAETGRKAIQAGGELFRTGEYDPEAPLKVARTALGAGTFGTLLPASRGALGAAGGRMTQPTRLAPSEGAGAAAAVRPQEVHALSSVPILSPGPAQFKPHSREVETIAAGLQNRGQEVLKRMGVESGRIEASAPHTDEIIKNTLAHETKAALEREGHAGDWYKKSVQEAVDTAAMIYPKVKSDPHHNFMWKAAKAITSQDETVPRNVDLTDYAYKHFAETGKLPATIKAQKADIMTNNFEKVNKLVEDLGPEKAREFMNKQFTVRELEEAGYNIAGYNKEDKVYGSAILGPKIGQGFFQNLNGNFDPVTFDLWWMRTWGRLTGTLSGNPEYLPKARSKFEDALRAGGQKVPRNAPQLDALAERMRVAHERDFKANRKLYDSGKKVKSAATNAAIAYQKAKSGIVQQPTSATQRHWMRRMVEDARKQLAEDGIHVTNADLQALIWYPEKDLYERLGGRKSSGINMNYAQAWRKRAKEQGFSDAQIDAAIKAQ